MFLYNKGKILYNNYQSYKKRKLNNHSYFVYSLYEYNNDSNNLGIILFFSLL
jgi:hypothetical protein